MKRSKQSERPEFYRTKSIAIKLSLKDVDTATGRVQAYAAAFNNIDSDNDIILPGAFTKTVEEQGPKGSNRIAFLYQHDPMKPLAKPTSLIEDTHGLLFDATISKTTWGLDALILYENKVINEHSIGFMTTKSDRNEETGVRTIRECKLYDVSCVMWGANEFTPVVSLKSKRNAENMIEQIDSISRALTRPLTDETAQALELKLKQMKQAFVDLSSLVQPPAEPDTDEPIAAETLASLRAIHEAMTQYL